MASEFVLAIYVSERQVGRSLLLPTATGSLLDWIEEIHASAEYEAAGAGVEEIRVGVVEVVSRAERKAAR